MPYQVKAEVLIPRWLDSREDALHALDLITRFYQSALPRRFGNTEPLRKAYDPSEPESFLASLHHSVYWKGQGPGTQGYIMPAMDRREGHGYLGISVAVSKADVRGLIRFLEEASSQLGADFACLHLPAEGDMPTMLATHTGTCGGPKRFLFFVTTHRLVRCVPDLYWATVFGPPYIEHFGRDRILSAPASVVRELDGGHIYIQLSESRLDLTTDFARVDAVRQDVKRHLNNNSFFDLHLPADHVYNVPEFHMESEDDLVSLDEPPVPRQAEDTARAPAPLDESEPKLQDQVLDTAEAAIRHAKEHFGVDLDYSPDSVRKVEEILAVMHGGKKLGRKLSRKEASVAATLYGSYIGEVMRRQRGGKW